MSKRLVKVAKELNVGTKTIVEFFEGKGFTVSNKPTAKITDEQYDLLTSNFKKSIDLKEKADQISIGVYTNKKLKEEEKTAEEAAAKESKNNDTPPAKVEPKTEAPAPEKPVEEKPVVEKTEVKEDLEAKTAIKGPKIVGKIDLSNIGSKRKKPVKKSEPKTQVKPNPSPKPSNKEKAESKPVTPVTPPVAESKKEAIKPAEKTTKQPVVKQTKQPKTQKQAVTKKEPVAEKTPNKEKNSTPETTPKVEDTSKEESTSKEEKAATTAQDNSIKHEAPTLKGLKILGKINLDADKPKRKKKRTDNNASTDKRKKGNASDKDGDNRNRRKRTRIKKDDTNKTQGTTTNNKNQGTTAKSKDSSNDANSKDRRRVFRNSDAQSKKPTDYDKKRKVKKGPDATKSVKSNMQQVLDRLSGRGKKKRFGTSRKERDEKRIEKEIQAEATPEATPKLLVTEFISVSELAGLMNIASTDIIMACMREKRMVSINQRMDAELIELMGLEFGFEIEFISAEDQIEKDFHIEDDSMEDDTARAPIVTVMGHVDHGKTSLLDRIRKANVADGEAGGITQHIGAYEVTVPGQGPITFLDTPGHEAFTAMRARGAKVTDIAVVIIAADDNVMPQTKEAISHAQAAEVPIIFAINKIDKDGASVDRIKQELAGMNLLVEDWGGEFQSQEISAKQGLNIDTLLEKIILEAEMLELKANPKKRAVGTVLEASLEKGRGYVAKVLVQNGTLSIGDPMIAGPHYGRVKAMFNERGKRIKKAGPATPVLVLGLQGAPQAGERLNVLGSEKEAKELADKRANIVRQQQIRATRRVTLDDITNRIKIGNFKELNIIVKGDFDGSVEALSDSLLKLSTDQVQTNIIYKAVGPVTESDVNLAAASNAIIVGFQVRPNPMARRLAEQEGIELKTYSVIYDAIDEIRSALEGMLEPKQVEEVVGMVEIQQVFKITKVGAVAGCFVQEGKILRNSYIRIIRDGIVQFPKKEGVHGELSSLKRFKDNVSEVKNNMECGLTIKGYNDMKEGDMIEVYEIKEVKQKL